MWGPVTAKEVSLSLLCIVEASLHSSNERERETAKVVDTQLINIWSQLRREYSMSHWVKTISKQTKPLGIGYLKLHAS